MEDRVKINENQALTNVHPASACAGRNCPIHNPSQRAMNIGDLYWRTDVRRMERVCEHGVGHWDIDELDFLINERGMESAVGIHGCDGCCAV